MLVKTLTVKIKNFYLGNTIINTNNTKIQVNKITNIISFLFSFHSHEKCNVIG